MSEMKLIMENWKRFEKGPDAGTLCLFENRRVKRVPFMEALNSIGNTEKELDLFLEKWEKSLNYEFKRINEGWEEEARNQAAEHGEEVPQGAENSKWGDFKQDPILYLSNQVFLFMQKAKEDIIKNSGKILSFIDKINSMAKRFEKSNPTLYKVGKSAATVAIAMVVLYALSHILGTDQAQAGDLIKQVGTQKTVIANEAQLLQIGNHLVNSTDPQIVETGKALLKVAESAQDVASGGYGSEWATVFNNSKAAADIALDAAEQGSKVLNKHAINGNLGAEYSTMSDEALRSARSIHRTLKSARELRK
tara:strand:- start:12705 stop:13625 length:921 start_codon:yes stop_codon:yes gene_type:complete